ncbi:MAG: ABC transporter permease [Gemmatimonadaceae bacterium]
MIRSFMWAVKRELWESRWLYLAPVYMAAVIVVGFAAYAIRLPGQMAALASLDTLQQRRAIVEPYDTVAGLMMLAGLLFGVIYCVDALYGERRDRSVLLWKSLPVSDATTVLAKLCIPVVVVPLIVWAATVTVHILMLAISTAILAANGQGATVLWTQCRLLPTALTLLYHLVALHGLSAAPLYGWLLLMSAWAPRAPFVWALLPPIGVAFLERVAFGTMRFAELVFSRLSGGLGTMQTPPGGTLVDSMTLLPLSQFAVAPALWTGFAITALLVAGAVRLRRRAQPI